MTHVTVYVRRPIGGRYRYDIVMAATEMDAVPNVGDLFHCNNSLTVCVVRRAWHGNTGAVDVIGDPEVGPFVNEWKGIGDYVR